MNEHHHVPDDLLSAYAAGTAPEAVALFVATHASLCPMCYGRISELEAVAGGLLAAAPALPRHDLLAGVLARLDAPPPVEPARHPPHPYLPAPLLAYTGPNPAWRRLVPGVETADLPLLHAGKPVVLTRLAAGTRVPPHTHRGWELQLVLSGGYTADDGRFDRGDAHCVDDGTTHSFRVDADAPCVSLLVRDARIVPTTLFGKFFTWLTGA